MAARHGGRERELRRLLKRDKDFKSRLSRAYGVEKAPAGVGNAIDKALASLPENVPVRHRPVLRAVKSFATCAALLALVITGLCGLNNTYPQLTEALPGLGQVFAAINGGRTPRPPADSSQLPDEEETAEEFSPVVAESDDAFFGDMTITDAWSDGKSLIMRLEMEASQKMQNYLRQDWEALYDGTPTFTLYTGARYSGEMDAPPVESQEQGTGMDLSQVKVESGGESYTGHGDFSELVINGDGNVTGTWRVDLDHMERTDGELAVSVRLPALTLEEYEPVSGNYGQMLLEPDYEAGFTVPVDNSHNRTIQGTVTDNGSVLYSVDYSPSRVKIDIDIPSSGYLGDLALDQSLWKDTEGVDFYSPLNTFGELEAVSRSGDGKKYELDYAKSGVAGDQANGQVKSVRYSYVFRPAGDASMEELCKDPGVLRLTMYETPDIWPEGLRRRVGSQFRIDLNTGRVSASEDYLEQGLERSDIEADPDAWLDEALASGSGIACVGVDLAVDGAEYPSILPHGRVMLAADSEEKLQDLVFMAYSDGGMYTFSLDDSDFIGGMWTEEYILPSSGRLCWIIEIEILYPEELLAYEGYGQVIKEPYLKLELLRPYGDSGYEEIIPDLEQAWLSCAGKAVGGLEGDALIDMMQSIIYPMGEGAAVGRSLPDLAQEPVYPPEADAQDSPLEETGPGAAEGLGE